MAQGTNERMNESMQAFASAVSKGEEAGTPGEHRFIPCLYKKKEKKTDRGEIIAPCPQVLTER